MLAQIPCMGLDEVADTLLDRFSELPSALDRLGLTP
jgi:hypothetical protein